MKIPFSPLEGALRAIRIYPDHCAVTDGDLSLTYREFGEQVSRLGELLRERGLQAGGHVLLIAPNRLDTLLAFHAVPLAGGVLVPLNPAFDDHALNTLSRHCDPQLALVDAAHVGRVQATLDALGVPVIPICTGEALNAQWQHLAPQPLLAWPPGLDENAPISINYTGGTTADPKGVMLTHRNAFVNNVNMLYHLNLHPGSTYLHAIPLAHANGWGCAWAVTAAGGTHVMLRGDLRLAIQGGITHLCASPSLVGPLADAAAASPLPRPVRLMLAGTSPQPGLISALQAQGFEVLHGYGLVETAAILTITDLYEEKTLGPDARIVARQGHPMLYGGEIAVLGEGDLPVPHDGHTPGEIVIRSNAVMKGYYKNPRATRRAIKNGWLHTGDLAVIHPDGRMDILDREGDLLNIGGQPISSVQIEAVLYRHPSVREAVVVAAQTGAGDLPVAFVTLHPGAQVQGREILSFCSPHLPDYALPRRVQLVPELPKTASGKVLKHVLREKANEWRER
ncbi:AMP-binding protein [Deinococcus sp.]|uniref:AMP-binding protein n=1 Tax=Deinococcus sp. TaxID=47478 RepID=UPI0025BE53C9|nr:AMP-binding protein [Deinococcus sp.]